MASTLSNRLTRLEQSNPGSTGEGEVEIVQYYLDPDRPELGSFERHSQYGAVVYDGLDELLAIVSGKTRSV
jgi:hypothetical protein